MHDILSSTIKKTPQKTKQKKNLTSWTFNAFIKSNVSLIYGINVKSTALCRSQPLLHYLPTTSHIKKLNTFFNKMFNALIKSNFSFLHVNLSLSTHAGCFLDTRQVRSCEEGGGMLPAWWFCWARPCPGPDPHSWPASSAGRPSGWPPLS